MKWLLVALAVWVVFSTAAGLIFCLLAAQGKRDAAQFQREREGDRL